MTALRYEMADQQETAEAEEIEVIHILQEYFKKKSRLIHQFTDSAAEIENKPVQHLINMTKIDSLIHMDICLLAIAILQGESMANSENESFNSIFQVYHELEKSSKKRARTISKNLWVKENNGLKKLITQVKDGEKRSKKFIQRAFDKLINKKGIQQFDMNPMILDSLMRKISVILEELGNPI